MEVRNLGDRKGREEQEPAHHGGPFGGEAVGRLLPNLGPTHKS